MDQTDHQSAAASQAADPVSMNLFHAALLRDLTRARLLLISPATLTHQRATRLGKQLLWLLNALEIHHQGEDDHLWPLLAQREAASQALLDDMLAEHKSIDQPMHQLRSAATGLAYPEDVSVGAREAALAAVEALVPPLCAHLRHEEIAALPIVRRVMTEHEWERFEQQAWASRRLGLDTVRFVVWLVDGVVWSPDLHSRFPPARQIPRWALDLASAVGRLPGVNPWGGTTASGIRPAVAL